MAQAQKNNAFQPCYLFFYGSLMDPDILQNIARLENPPVLQDASIEGYKMKMWGGTYPTLLAIQAGENDPGKVTGKAWKATTLDQIRNLEYYETSAYKITECKIQLNGNEIVDGMTFCWSGVNGDDELQEGSFDLEEYRKSTKPIMFGFR